ncbi:hypothetical protein [Hirschia baltica]|uniref:Uncharacterized protein n=1 Tax=Hirschia baltica (strain ATCC 49814 / DSM 5838 / IFAM 1418) TaxID=582402 RepID=C6XLA9_HIRBI|nr:hypothetical protein [Hirschia baltica]ACT59708.1 hypothetical protein Hbal_2025 [Hirschia baltica ATCC 49814]
MFSWSKQKFTILAVVSSLAGAQFASAEIQMADQCVDPENIIPVVFDDGSLSGRYAIPDSRGQGDFSSAWIVSEKELDAIPVCGEVESEDVKYTPATYEDIPEPADTTDQSQLLF